MSRNELEERVSELETHIEQLQHIISQRGINVMGDKDVFGRPFALPVYQEHKATVFSFTSSIWSFQQPHMRAFWGATFGFCSSFFSVFTPASLMPYIARAVDEGGIALTKANINDSASAAVGSTIIFRILAGPMCERLGARYTFIILLMLAVPGLLGLFFVQDATSFIVCRAIIGCGLASFVCCQVWCSQMFTKSLVGVANATAGGWGNLGGGITTLLIPAVMQGILSATDYDVNLSWRICMIIPIALHVLSSLFIFSGRDLPDGNYKELEAQGSKQKSKTGNVAKIGLTNVNAWILFITYGLCFGVELTMTNKVVNYFYRYYGVEPFIAGVCGSCFGLMNLFARSWGGMLSDACNKKWGMRGRLWSCWIVQTLEGLMCILMGLVTINMPGPDDFSGQFTQGTWTDYAGREPVNFLINSTVAKIPLCGTKEIPNPGYGFVDGQYTVFPESQLRTRLMMVRDVNPECVCNAAPLGLTMIVMVIFSSLVQMAEGLHFGIVPYVSRPALGIVSGMVGAGGNFGAVIGSKYIINSAIPVDLGFIHLGIIIMTVSCLMHAIYFPEHGAMLLPKGALGKYDPQIIKPPADMRGADMLDYSKSKDGKDGAVKEVQVQVATAAA